MKPAATQWHVLGAGAMGCLWAARLWQAFSTDGRHAAEPVCLLLRDEASLQRYRAAGGLVLEDSSGTRKLALPAETVFSRSGAAIDLLLAGTKAQDVQPALAAVEHRIHSGTLIVLLQNGLRVQREISAQYGAHRVYCLSTSHGAWLRKPFHVVHAGIGRSWLGQLPPAAVNPVVGRSSDQMQRDSPPAGLVMPGVRWDSNIEERLWRKLAVNCAINGLTVLYDCRNGELLTHPQAQAELRLLCEEITRLYVGIPDTPTLHDLPGQVEEVLRTTARNISSTLQDFRAGRPTELPHLNGHLIELAHRHHLNCPRNQQLLKKIPTTP